MKKKVKIKIPAPIDKPEVEFEPVAEEAPTTKLDAPLGPVRCVLCVKETFWSGKEYIVLSAVPGCDLPAGLKTGQEVDVQFLPPGGVP